MFVEWKTNMRVLCFFRQVFTPLLTISTIILRVLHNQYMHVSYRLLNFLSLIIKLDGKFTRSVHILTYCWYTVSENPIHVVSYLFSVVAALPSIDSILFIFILHAFHSNTQQSRWIIYFFLGNCNWSYMDRSPNEAHERNND